MTAPTPTSLRHVDHARARKARIARRVAAVAGAAGAAAAGEAGAVTYVPTAGVVAAQGIPGFSFTAPTTVTSGTLRPPTTTLADTAWDIDGSGTADFNLHHGLNVIPSSSQYAGLRPLNPFAANFNGLIATGTTVGAKLRNVADGAAVGPSALWNTVSQAMTTNLVNQQPAFPTNTPGTIGFRFAFGNSANQYYYGWASLTIDAQSPAGQGFKITEAFYQSTPNTAINVGAVPVPEPASMGVLALGATGIVAWRARRKEQSTAG